MGGPSSEQKKLTIRVRIPQSAVSPEVFQAQRAAGARRSGRWSLGGVALLVAGVGLWLVVGRSPAPVAVESAPPTGEVAAEATEPVAQTTTTASPVAAAVPSPSPATAPTENEVVRALITESMRGGSPGDSVGPVFTTNGVTRRVHFYTELKQSIGKRYTHVWEYNGKSIARIDFKSRGDSWRASSNKKLPTHMQGDWRARLLDEHGTELATVPLYYGPARQLTATQ